MVPGSDRDASRLRIGSPLFVVNSQVFRRPIPSEVNVRKDVPAEKSVERHVRKLLRADQSLKPSPIRGSKSTNNKANVICGLIFLNAVCSLHVDPTSWGQPKLIHVRRANPRTCSPGVNQQRDRYWIGRRPTF